MRQSGDVKKSKLDSTTTVIIVYIVEKGIFSFISITSIMITRHDVVYILNYISVLLLFLPICMVHVSFSYLINANSFCVKVEAIINCKFYFIKFIAPIVYTTSSFGGSYNFFLVLSAIFRTKFVKVFFYCFVNCTGV